MSEQNKFKCKWLTPIITLDEYDNNWEKYNDKLYEIFVRDFITNELFFNNKKVCVRINVKQNNYEHAFIHLTCVSTKMSNDPNDRIPDFRRCERLEWNREIIENYICKNNCTNCRKILFYEHYYKNRIRINLVFADVRFKVILEKRKNYYLLITGYYIEFDHTLRKEINKAELFRKQKTPLD